MQRCRSNISKPNLATWWFYKKTSHVTSRGTIRSFAAATTSSKQISRYGLMFPGQGSQHVGMGLDLHAKFDSARRVFEQVDEALGERLSSLMFHGDALELQKTSNAQPAIMAHSMAALAAATEEENGCLAASTPQVFMGHSLGEFTAACAAGCIELPDAARLVRARGLAMEAAVTTGRGEVSMVAIMPIDYDNAIKLCTAAAKEQLVGAAEAGVCSVANWNADKQIVLSGSKLAVENAVALGKEKFKVRRAVQLDVSAPFHCSLMAPAEARVQEMLEELSRSDKTKNPTTTMIMNVNGATSQTWEEIQQGLIQQTCRTVKWVKCMNTAVELHSESDSRTDSGSDSGRDPNSMLPMTWYEVGPGSTLSSLMRRAVPKHWSIKNIACYEDVRT